LIFKTEFLDMESSLEKQQSMIESAFKQLRSENFVTFLQRVLVVSNHLNKDNNAAKDAKGFPLSNLLLLKEVKSTVDPSITLLNTIVEFLEGKEPHLLEIEKLGPDFNNAGSASMTLMQQIPTLITKLMPIEKELKACTEQTEASFKKEMKDFSARVVKHLIKVNDIIRKAEEDIQFFGDNEFLGSPPYPAVESFSRCWDQIKIDHPGKTKRAQRNAECYAFFVNVGQFLTTLQKTHIFIEAKRKKQQRQQKPVKEKRKTMNDEDDVVGSMVSQLQIGRNRTRTRAIAPSAVM